MCISLSAVCVHFAHHGLSVQNYCCCASRALVPPSRFLGPCVFLPLSTPSAPYPPLARRYLALSFTVVGTLVDLFPEMLLVSEIMLHPSVLTSAGSLGTLLRLIFSDGKPVVVFAATDEFEKPLAPPMLLLRDSLRRRLSCVAAGFSLRDGCIGDRNPKWTYAG